MPEMKPSKQSDKAVFELQAEVCKTIANPKRIEIIHALKGGERTVSELVAVLGAPKANVSQHLAMMRSKGVLKARREGVNIYYSLTNPKVTQACMLMREVLTEQLQERKQTLGRKKSAS